MKILWLLSCGLARPVLPDALKVALTLSMESANAQPRIRRCSTTKFPAQVASIGSGSISGIMDALFSQQWTPFDASESQRGCPSDMKIIKPPFSTKHVSPGLAMMVVAILVMETLPLLAQLGAGDNSYIDPACIADDENFVKLFDVLAVVFAALGCFVLPLLWPFFPGVTSEWTWSSPSRRWWILAGVFIGGFVLFVFLPPQLARVGLLTPNVGMYFFDHLGNVRARYLTCDLTSIPRDYGFLFAIHWNPGPNSLIQYWWAQLAVFGLWVVVFGVLYLLITAIAPARRLEALGK